jgi:hypothetical protein
MGARRIVWIGFLAFLGGAQATIAAPVEGTVEGAGFLLHPEQSEPSIDAQWLGLEERGDLLELSRPQLGVLLENPGREDAWVESRLRVVVDGRVSALHLPPVRVGALRSRTVPVTLPPGLVRSRAMRFSGKITLALEVAATARDPAPGATGNRRGPGRGDSHGGDSVDGVDKVQLALPAVYFHWEGRRLIAYREDVLREAFGAGNFRGLELDAPEPFTAIRGDLDRAGLGGTLPVLASVQTASSFPVLPDDILPPGSKMFCFGLDGSAFDDSGEVPGVVFAPPTEDFGREGEFVPAPRGWVAVGQLGAPLFTGFLDAGGCTPFVVANSTDEISVAFFPLYLRESNDIRGFVSDLNLGPQWPESMPYFLFFFSPGSAVLSEVLLDGEEPVNTIFVAAANAMEQVPGGLGDVLYEFQLREAGDNAGTNTSYAPEGHPLVRVKYSLAAREKFVIGHEYAHALHIATLSPPITEDDLDYSVTANEADQHALDSKEWQLTAAFEGFAHFVSGLVWNEAVPDDDAVFRSGGGTFELDPFDRIFETTFDAAQFPDQGVELDWAQFFWNYHTDEYEAASGDPVLAPPSAAILDMWRASYPWPVNEGFFGDFRDGVVTILGTFGPANPVAEGLERFDAIAAAAGVDH